MAKVIKISQHKRAGKMVRAHSRRMDKGGNKAPGKGNELAKKTDAATKKQLELIDKLANTIYDIGAGSGIQNSPEYDMNRNVTALSQP